MFSCDGAITDVVPVESAFPFDTGDCLVGTRTRIGDGFDGWPDEAPFDAILVTAAPATIPEPLLDQLAIGGRLVIPVGRGVQELVVVTRTEDGYDRRVGRPVRFVPMTGKAQGR